MMNLSGNFSTFNFQEAPCGIFVLDSELRLTSANTTLAQMLGTTAPALLGKTLDQLLTSANRLMFHMQVMSILHIQGSVEEIFINLAGAEGKEVPVLFNAIRRESENGTIMECMVFRVKERQRLEDELFRVKKAVEQIPGMVYQYLTKTDGSSSLPYASEGIRKIFELSPLQVQTNAALVFNRIHSDDLDSLILGIKASEESMTVFHQQYRVNLPRGGMRWLESDATPEARADGSFLWHGYITDITERKILEAALANEYERTRVTLSSIGDAVITTDDTGNIEYINPIAENLTGWSLADAIGKPILEVFNIINQHTRLIAKNPIAYCLEVCAIVELARDTVLISKSGIEYSVEDSAAPIFTADGVVTGVVMVFRDVTGQRILRQEVEHRATHDHLTGLPNRAEFDRVLAQLFSTACDSAAVHSICCIDLDQFKIVNDSAGHAAGDLLLQQVAKLMQECVRGKDMVARLGGDEFGLLLENCDLPVAQRIAQTICDRLADLRFQHGGKVFRIGGSIGVAPLDNRWSSAQAAQQAADGGCFAAKEAGRGRVHLYQDIDKVVLAQHDKMQWAARLQQAIDDDCFELFAQPIMPLTTSSANGVGSIGLHFEVLLRLRDTDGTLISPGAFIPAAERYGLASKIDRWVLKAIDTWMEKHRALLDRINTIAINLSGRSVGDSSFHLFVSDLLDQGRIVASKICFEITETSAIDHLDDALNFLHMLHQRGARVSLDDFGSGLSSMAYLKRLPVDYLKIDGQFVKDMAIDAVDRAMVRSINEIAHLTQKITIAEFVEDGNVLASLRELGVDFAQGYHIGRPAPIDQILTWQPTCD